MTVVCQECGNAAPSPDGFCTSCGALLEWSGEPVAPPPTAPPITFVSPIKPTGSSSANPYTYPPSGSAVPSPPTAPQPATSPAASPPLTTPPATSYQSAAPPSSTPPTAPPTAPPPGVLPTGVLPTGVLPMEEAIRPAPVRLVTDPNWDGLYCSACGARNAAGRNFCRSCGGELDVSLLPTKKQRWWQKLFSRKPKSGPAAGERPKDFRKRELAAADPSAPGAKKRKRRWRIPRPQLSRIAPLLIVAGMLGYGLGPGRLWLTKKAGELFGQAKEHVSNDFTPVTPVAAKASTSAKKHDPRAAIDKVADTFWESTDKQGGIGQSITITFANPTDIDRIGLLSGATGEEFSKQGRVQTFALNADGKPGPQLNFGDTVDFQNTEVTLRGVKSITFVVVGSFRGQKGSAIAIRELQFFQRK